MCTNIENVVITITECPEFAKLLNMFLMAFPMARGRDEASSWRRRSRDLVLAAAQPRSPLSRRTFPPHPGPCCAALRSHAPLPMSLSVVFKEPFTVHSRLKPPRLHSALEWSRNLALKETVLYAESWSWDRFLIRNYPIWRAFAGEHVIVASREMNEKYRKTNVSVGA